MATTQRLHDYSCLTFDCYGTLIDWHLGLERALRPLYSQLSPPHSLYNDIDGILAAYSKIERALEVENPTELYRNLIAETYQRLAAELGVKATEADGKSFAATLGDWPAYPDTVAALQRLKKHFKLVILSNVDNESFRQTLARQFKGVEFDAIYTAEDIGSYKPDRRNFEYLLQHCKDDLGVEKGQVIHTAVSLFHDLTQAKDFGIANAWIQRYKPDEELKEFDGKINLTWRFKTLGEMADAYDAEEKKA